MSYEPKELNLTFPNKQEADAFLKTMRKLSTLYDVITVKDILIGSGHCDQVEVAMFKYGYTKAVMKAVKAWKDKKGGYSIRLPVPGRITRTDDGFWSTESVVEEV